MNIKDIKVTKGCFTYLVNLEEKSASIVSSETTGEIVFIPYSIQYESSECIVKSILRHAFKDTQIKLVQFAGNSQISTIEFESFLCSEIECFTAPPHLKKICYKTFSFCIKLVNVVIPENSELQKIEDFAFNISSIESINIPQMVKLYTIHTVFYMTQLIFCKQPENQFRVK